MRNSSYPEQRPSQPARLNRVCSVCRISSNRAVIRGGLCKTCRRYAIFGRAVASFAEVAR